MPQIEAITPDPLLRSKLLDFYVETGDASSIIDWLRQLGVPTGGSMSERRERVRENTKYLSMSAADFPQQTRWYLEPHSSDSLADLCLELGLSDEGNRESRYRRIMREVHYREVWMPRWVGGCESPTPEVVATYLELF